MPTPKNPRPFIVEEIDGKLVKRALKMDGTPYKLRAGKGRRNYNPNPNPGQSLSRKVHNPSINARMKLIKELSGGAINPYRKGVWDGYTKETAAPVWHQAKREAKAIVKYLKENDMVDMPKDEKYASMADEALEAAITVVRTPANEQVKIAAARLVLDFTRSKPAAKNEVTVNKAEDWLASVMADMKNDESGTA
jgi:hypothetical protein